MTASLATTTRNAEVQALIDDLGATGAKAKIKCGTQPSGVTANYSTTLAAAITTTGQTAITVSSASGMPTSAFKILIDSEWMLVTAGFGTTSLTVTRAQAGTTAATHSNGAAVADFQLNATLNWATTKIALSVTNGVATLDAADMTQTNTNHVAALGTDTPSYIDFTTSADVLKWRVPIGGGFFSLTGTIQPGQNVTLSSPTVTAGNP